MRNKAWYINASGDMCIGREGNTVLLGNLKDGTFKLFTAGQFLEKLVNSAKSACFYREDQLQRIEFDAPRVYVQRPATDADRADEDRSEIISEDGWIDEHEDIIDASDGTLICDLFEFV